MHWAYREQRLRLLSKIKAFIVDRLRPGKRIRLGWTLRSFGANFRFAYLDLIKVGKLQSTRRERGKPLDLIALTAPEDEQLHLTMNKKLIDVISESPIDEDVWDFILISRRKILISYKKLYLEIFLLNVIAIMLYQMCQI